MRFAFPLGLLGLIGIPILIAIYILKNKYTEQTVSSTYIWTVSEKFLKNKKKLPKIAGIISLILQIIIVATISVLIAGPSLIFPDAASEYCFILDASGSMNTKENGKTRFEIGKEEIKSVIEKSQNGGLYTLVYVGDTATSVLFEHEDNKEDAIGALDALTPSHSGVDVTDAIEIAQGYFTKNRGAKVYFITDANYKDHNNVEIINVARGEENFSINSPTYIIKGNTITASAKFNATADREITVDFFYNDDAMPTETKKIGLKEGVSGEISFTKEASTFEKLTMRIREDDALLSDNEAVIYNLHSQDSYSTLIISDTPFFFKTAIETVTSSSVVVLSKKDYNEKMEKVNAGKESPISGYGLYVFDGIKPDTLPKDGSVWLVNISESVEGSGISFQGDVDSKEIIYPKLSEVTSTLSEKLSANLNGRDISICKFIKYGVSGFTPIYEYNKQPLVFANENEHGNRQIVFAFSLHDSNLPLLGDFIPLISNLLKYSFPDILDRANYECGERLEINAPQNATEIKITTPSGVAEYPTSSAVASEFILNEPGTYKISVTVGDGAEKSTREHLVSAVLDESESTSTPTNTAFSLQGKAREGGLDAIYDDIIILVILLAVIFSVDWMVYCYDKYQLR